MSWLFKQIFAIFFLAFSLCGQTAPKRLFIDSNTSKSAKAELTLQILQSCSAKITAADSRELADYTVSVNRTNTGFASAVIAANGDIVDAFRPSRTATLRTVAERVCDFFKSRE